MIKVTYKIVLVGCGGMSNIWLDYASQKPDAEIVGLVDLNLTAAKEKAKQRQLDVPIYQDVTLAIKETKAELVFDVTMPAAHKQVVTTALQEGCHVFGEKPMAESLEDAEAIIKIADQTGKRYSVMQNRRFLKEIRSIRNFIAKGEIGELHTLNADFYLGPHFGGFREEMNHPLIVDMAIHTFDQARFISNSNAVSVYCHEFNPSGSWYEGNASAICIFEMENGVVFTYRGSWAAEGLPTSWNSDWRMIGTKGTVTWDGADTISAETVDEAKSVNFLREMKPAVVPLNWHGQEEHAGCLDEMFAALEQKRIAETDGHDNIQSMKMIFAAIESAKSGEKVKL